ncbi:hypothetical protein [Desulfobacula sp.]
MKHKRTMIQFLIILSGLSLLVFSGCGKKAMPMAPQIKGQKIAAPFDLKYQTSGSQTLLSWSHKVDKKTAFVKPEGFDVFMAKKTFEACVGCPFEFKMIKSVSMPLMELIVPTEHGFKYYFRVQATGPDNMRSKYSKTVQVDCKSK